MKHVFLMSALLAAMAPAIAYDVPNGLNQDGIANIKIGVAVERLEVLLHDKLGYNQYENHGCSILTTKQLEPTGLSVMIENKILTRINVDYVGKSDIPRTIKTDTGLGLGSSEADVLKTYPNARIKPNAADPTWHTIFVETSDRAKALVFETNGQVVKSMRAGANPAISYPNGCN